MKRKIDELGRIVIPKEIRKSLKLNMGDSLEIYIEDNKISLRKYSSLKGYEEELFNIAKIINELTNSTILFIEEDKVVVSYGKLSEIYIDQEINNSIYNKDNIAILTDLGVTKDYDGIYKNLNMMGIIVYGEYLSNEEVLKELDPKKYGYRRLM